MRKIRCYGTRLLVILLMLSAFSGLIYAQNYDFGGGTVKIQHNLTYDRVFENNPEALAHLDWVQNEFNVKIEWTSGYRDERVVEPLAAAVMAGDAPDLIRMQSRALSLAASKGLLMPLDEKLIKNTPLIKTHIIDSYSKFGDKYYGFAHQWPRAGMAIFWNKDMFEREGLPNLYDIYNAGEWTWDVFRDLALKATRDTDGDGEIDQWGAFLGNQNDVVLYTLPAFLYSNGVELLRFDENGRPVYAFDDPAVIETYEFVLDLYNSGAAPLNPSGNIFREGKAAMTRSNPDAVGNLADMEDDFGMVPIPRGPRLDYHTSAFTHADVWAVSITTQHDPAALIELIHALERVTEPYMDSDMETILQETIDSWAMKVRDWETVENYIWNLENTKIFTFTDVAYFPDYRNVTRAILFEGESPATALAAIRDKTQAHLDALFGYKP